MARRTVGAYWGTAPARIPDLHFELVEVLVAPTGLVILYRNQAGVLVAECLNLDVAGQVREAIACYA